MNVKLIPFILLLFLSEVSHTQAGRSERNHLIFSTHLQESRIIDISLPKDYEWTKKDYPVLYLLDGEYVFGYAKGVVDFLTNPFGYLPDMIVVSIPNIDRNRDLLVTLNPEGGYLDFVMFLVEEVITLVNKMYRTNGFNILYGWSSGSGICSYLFANRPDLFDGYILAGTAIGPKSAEMISKNIPSKNYRNKYFYANTEGTKYLNTIGKGPRVNGFQKYSELINKLKPTGLRWKFDLLETSSHVDVLAEGLHRGLNFIYADFYIPDTITCQGTKTIISYYQAISANYSFEVEIPRGTISESAFILLQEDKADEAMQLVLHGLTIHPESSDLLGTLGEIHEYKNELELAANYYKMAFEKSVADRISFLKYQALYHKLQSLGK